MAWWPHVGSRKVGKHMSLKDRTFLRKVDVPYKEPVGDIWEIAKTCDSMFKWHHYYTAYEERLAPYRDRPVRVLEIGVHYGGSLKLWHEYVHPDSTIVGVDIEERCSRYARDNISVEIGDQSDEGFLQTLVDKYGEFDIIIDDGSHKSEHQRASWQLLFREGLADGGIYIVEDTYNSYFAGMTEAGTPPFMATAKTMIDLMHMNYMLAGNTGPFIHEDPVGYAMPMEYYEAWISSVEFCDGMIIFKKRLRSASHAPKLMSLDLEEHGLE